MSDTQVHKTLMQYGIDENISWCLIAAERETLQLYPNEHKIDFTDHEPDDDRIFSTSQMFEFAHEIAQEFAAAILKGSKSIDGVQLDEYIHKKLSEHEGDGNAESWIPYSKYPSQK